MDDFDRLQAALPDALAANVPGLRARPRRRRDGVVQPQRLAAGALRRRASRRMEHRYLNASLLLNRIDADLVFVCSLAPAPRCSTTTASSWPPTSPTGWAPRSTSWPSTTRSPAPARREAARPPRPARRGPPPRRRAHRRDRAVERHRARGARWPSRSACPINGTAPDLRSDGVQERRPASCSTAPASRCPSAARTCTRVDDVAAAAEWIRASRPGVGAVVVKHDDSGAGDGNAVRRPARRLRRRTRPARGAGRRRRAARLVPRRPRRGRGSRRGDGRRRPAAQPQRAGRPAARRRACGCSPPTTRCSAATTGRSTSDAGSPPTPRTPPTSPATATPSAASSPRAAASAGSASTSWPPARATGPGRSPPSRSTCARAARRTRSRRCAAWCPGTTTPSRAPGSPTPTAAPGPTAPPTTSSTRRWPSAAPSRSSTPCATRACSSTARSGTGVVLHMLGCLAVDGRFGATAIGRTPEHADELYAATLAAVVPRGADAVELSR